METNNKHKWLTHRKLAERFKAQGSIHVARYHYQQAILYFHAMNLEEERKRINENY